MTRVGTFYGDTMLNRRHLLGALAASVTLSFAAVATAMEKTAFDLAAFEADQAAGKHILVEVTAPWCPVCKAQAPTLARLKDDARFKDMVRFNIDFDTQKDLLQKF